MEVFGIIAFVFSLTALAKVVLLEKKLRDTGVLKKDESTG